uniref:Uncharacterized protein n=1 Tax=Cannabis sativa TaxID=3483 RepID=A0A803R1B8_CANSA
MLMNQLDALVPFGTQGQQRRRNGMHSQLGAIRFFFGKITICKGFKCFPFLEKTNRHELIF